MTLYWLVHGGFENGLWVIIIPLNSNVSKNRQPLSIHQFKPHIFTSFPIPLMLNTPTPGWVLGSHGRWLKKSVMKDTFSTQILRQTSNSLASARRRAARASKTLKARKASFPSFPWRKMGEKMPRWNGPFGTCLEERTNIFGNPRFWMCFIIFQQQNGCCHCPMQFQPNLLAGSRTTFGLSKADRLTEKICQTSASSSPARYIFTKNCRPSSVKCAATPGDLGEKWNSCSRTTARRNQCNHPITDSPSSIMSSPCLMCQDWNPHYFQDLFLSIPHNFVWQPLIRNVSLKNTSPSNNKWAIGFVWRLDTPY